jgi:hypothetical protein
LLRENAEEIKPATTKATVSHATHLQRLPGSLPVGNRRNTNTWRPMIMGRIQEAIQASASPAGSEFGSADKV